MFFQDYDILIGPLTVTPEREADFQETSPFYSIAYNFMYHKPSLSPVRQIFQFTVAFTPLSWALILITAVVFAVTLTLVNWISPNNVNYGIHPSMLFTFGYLFQVKSK